ncbi:MAG: hypothetical protein EBR82_66770 [Caulobacteraceae bacterium]|nr:hypothetical protein [Caulobacteraceae bacterium]
MNKWIYCPTTASVYENTGQTICRLPAFYENNQKNAHLIAAAPDLLEALRACLDPLQQAQNKTGSAAASSAFLAARAAIAKAEGEG